MYNKLFTKILDSSIWLAPSDTRLVWITFIAAMDEDGIVRLATVRNVANRALVSVESAQKAIDELEGPDPETPECPFQGRRIERVPGGWLVLKASEYREMVTRHAIREKTRERVARHRQREKGANSAAGDQCNAHVTESEHIKSKAIAKQEEEGSGERVAAAPPRPAPRGLKNCPEDWKPSERLLERIKTEELEECLARGGTSLEMELERFRSCTFRSARTDWDKTAWNWLLTECKQIMQKEKLYGARQNNRR